MEPWKWNLFVSQYLKLHYLFSRILKKITVWIFLYLRLWPPLLKSERDEILTILLRAEKGPNHSFLTIFNAITCSGGLCCSCFIARHILMTIDIRRAGKKYTLHLTTKVQLMNNFIKNTISKSKRIANQGLSNNVDFSLTLCNSHFWIR